MQQIQWYGIQTQEQAHSLKCFIFYIHRDLSTIEIFWSTDSIDTDYDLISFILARYTVVHSQTFWYSYLYNISNSYFPSLSKGY